MKGFILKDLYTLQSYLKSTLFILVVLCLSWGIMGQNMVAVVMVCVLISAATINTFSYDELSHWDGFSVTMPISRRQIVQSKYLGFLIQMGIGTLIGLIYGGISALFFGDFATDFPVMIFSLAAAMVVAAYMTGVTIPLIYRYGTQKMRFLRTFVMILPLVGLVGVMPLFLSADKRAALEGSLPSSPPLSLLWLVPVLIVLILGISYVISLRIFQKKEF